MVRVKFLTLSCNILAFLVLVNLIEIWAIFETKFLAVKLCVWLHLSKQLNPSARQHHNLRLVHSEHALASYTNIILVPRDRAPFSQHQELLHLAGSDFLGMCRDTGSL